MPDNHTIFVLADDGFFRIDPVMEVGGGSCVVHFWPNDPPLLTIEQSLGKGRWRDHQARWRAFACRVLRGHFGIRARVVGEIRPCVMKESGKPALTFELEILAPVPAGLCVAMERHRRPFGRPRTVFAFGGDWD